jgi:hypothetical protein
MKITKNGKHIKHEKWRMQNDEEEYRQKGWHGIRTNINPNKWSISALVISLRIIFICEILVFLSNFNFRFKNLKNVFFTIHFTIPTPITWFKISLFIKFRFDNFVLYKSVFLINAVIIIPTMNEMKTIEIL